ncbi:DUF4245 family protein [Nocardioides sp. SYSU DS0663]|uniref:DUF4245 family protein n=1 Tax=Nocardioides sp. SYSU DS0663 TaxID=3416445 RepID=UPI003F4BAFEE
MSETGKPGRYQRTTNGLVGSMIVVVLVVIAFVVVRSFVGRDLEVQPEPVDYLEAVRAAQAAGDVVVYPPALPAGWIATNARSGAVSATGGEDSPWFLALLTDEGRFIGVRQEDDSVEDLLEEHVDSDTDELGPVSVDGLVEEWQAYSDDGGDRAYAAELGEDTLLVYGSASERDLQTVLGLLAVDAL